MIAKGGIVYYDHYATAGTAPSGDGSSRHGRLCGGHRRLPRLGICGRLLQGPCLSVRLHRFGRHAGGPAGPCGAVDGRPLLFTGGGPALRHRHRADAYGAARRPRHWRVSGGAPASGRHAGLRRPHRLQQPCPHALRRTEGKERPLRLRRGSGGRRVARPPRPVRQARVGADRLRPDAGGKADPSAGEDGGAERRLPPAHQSDGDRVGPEPAGRRRGLYAGVPVLPADRAGRCPAVHPAAGRTGGHPAA